MFTFHLSQMLQDLRQESFAVYDSISVFDRLGRGFKFEESAQFEQLAAALEVS